jgi:5-methylcytosine-specific restriction endonuclease McrA
MLYGGFPGGDPEADYDDAVLRRRSHAQALARLSPQVKDAYGLYMRQRGRPQHISPARLCSADREVLAANYDLLYRPPLRAIRQRLLEAAPGGLCLLCGLGQATTLDHYLPKARYPEYAILRANLVPACARCNTLKRDTVPAQGRFVHPYFDSARTALIEAAIVIQDGLVLVGYHPTKAADEERADQEMVEAFRTHFLLMQLGEYFTVEAHNEISERSGGLRELWLSGGASLVRRFLSAQTAQLLRLRGFNYWKTALYTAMQENEALCDLSWDRYVL